MTLSPNSQTAQPLTPRTFQVQLHNVGADPTTYNLSVADMPADVTAQFGQTSISIAPGATEEVPLTLTQTSTTQLEAFNFVVTATIAGSTPVGSKSATGSLRTRNSFVSVTQVTVDHPFVNPGDSVDVTANPQRRQPAAKCECFVPSF